MSECELRRERRGLGARTAPPRLVDVAREPFLDVLVK
jgi:hypothetical protein